MDIEKYWDKYMNESLLDIFDETCEFFSQKLPEKVLEEYDVVEVILETKGHHETAKEFDKVLSFIQLIKEKQPDLYKENFQYLDDTLVEYYCFMNEPDKVDKAFSNFLKHPVHDFDSYLKVFKILIFNSRIDLIDKALNQNFDEVAQCDKLIGTAEYDLAMAKFYKTLEELYLDFKSKQIFDKQKFYGTLENFGFDLEIDYLESVEKGICDAEFDHEFFSAQFLNNRKSAMEYLLGHFLKYMHSLGFSFVLSGRIWDKVYELWESNVNKKQKKPAPEKYFNVHPDKFDKFLARLSGDLFISNTHEMVATLWGSVYIYDFLKELKIIDDVEFNNFIQATKKLKGIIIGQNTSGLWNFNFVHKWQKPDSISTVEFIEEEKIFQKSFHVKEREFSLFKPLISDELENIGELSKYIIDGAKTIKKTPSYDDIFEAIKRNDAPIDSQKKVKPEPEVKYVDPAELGNKVGRNEPCPCGSGKKYKKCCG
jgi:hypothetical protein